MLESIKQYAEALSGLTEVPRDRARRIAVSLSKQGVIPTGQIRTVASGIVKRSRQNRRRLAQLVSAQVRRQAGALGLATADEIERLRRRVLVLEGGPAKPAASARTAGSAGKKRASATTSKGRKRPATAAPNAGAGRRGRKPATRRVAAAARTRAGSTRKRAPARAASKRRR